MRYLILLIFLVSCASTIPDCDDTVDVPCQQHYEEHIYTYDELIRYEEFDPWVDDWRKE